MKETQPHKADEIAIVKQVEQKKQRARVGTIHPHEGHSIYEHNHNTKELKKATFKDAAISFTQNKNQPKIERKIIEVKENCFYLSSLNLKNAAKKIHKRFNGAYVIAINE